MAVEQVLVKELLANAGVATLVGTRIHPQVAPQGTAQPYVTYEMASSNPQHDHSGAAGLWAVRLSYLCHAQTYAGAKAVAAAIRSALDGRRGTIQGEAVKGILESEEADAGWDEVTRLHVIAIDFLVWL